MTFAVYLFIANPLRRTERIWFTSAKPGDKASGKFRDPSHRMSRVGVGFFFRVTKSGGCCWLENSGPAESGFGAAAEPPWRFHSHCVVGRTPLRVELQVAKPCDSTKGGAKACRPSCFLPIRPATGSVPPRMLF